VLVAVGGGEVVGVGNIDVRGDVPVIWKLYVLARVPPAPFLCSDLNGQ
jgi:hypothetical protein